MRSLVAAVDGSDAADRAIDLAADLASKSGARIVLVHVISASSLPAAPAGPTGLFRAPIRVAETSVPQVFAETANELLAKTRQRAEARGAPRIDTEVRAGDPAEEILSVAKDRDVDAIVVGKRGQGRLAGL